MLILAGFLPSTQEAAVRTVTVLSATPVQNGVPPVDRLTAYPNWPEAAGVPPAMAKAGTVMAATRPSVITPATAVRRIHGTDRVSTALSARSGLRIAVPP